MKNAEQYLTSKAIKAGGLFVTATDTGVGKTYLSCLLSKSWAKACLVPGVFKPAESGGDDAQRLRKASGSPLALEVINPFKWKHPLAPAMAAEIEGNTFRLQEALKAFKKIQSYHDLVLVEGAGGLRVPLNKRIEVADLAERLGLPLLIVARAGLGTINHTLLTIEAARKRKLEIAAVVVNGRFGSDLSVAKNTAELASRGKVTVLGPLKRGARDLKSLKVYAAR